MVELYDKDGILRAIVPDVNSIEELEEIIKHESIKDKLNKINHFIEFNRYQDYFQQHILNDPNIYRNKCGSTFCACTGACRGLKPTTYMAYA